jgi:retron-type reverse transcriptase
VEGQDGTAYGENLEANLDGLHGRLKECRYRAPPSKRVWIPKDGQGQRPLGVTPFEDKLAQRTVVMVFEVVYEQDFYSGSHSITM